MRVVALAILLLASACTAGRVATWERSIDLTKKGDDAALVKAGDDAFQGREKEASLRQAIELWEKAIALNPGNHETLVKLARAYYLLADGFLFLRMNEAKDDDRKDQIKKEMLEAFGKGVEYGERALIALSPAFREKVQAKVKVQDAVAVLTKEAVPALWWYATSLGKWARAMGLTKAVYHKDTVKRSVERVLELDRDFWYAGADRYFGAYYAYLSPMLGGDPAKSKAHFDRALQVAPNYFGTKVLLAEMYYGKRRPDRATFEKLLQEVIRGDPRSIPEVAPEQRLEQKKAELLLKQADDLF